MCKGDRAILSVSVASRAGQPNDVRINLQPNIGTLGGSRCSQSEAGWSGTLILSDTTAKDRRSLLLRAEGPAN